MQLHEGLFFDNRYLLKKFIDSGGFSEVWLVEDTKLENEEVALKVYIPDKGLDEHGIKLFREEFKILKGLSHSSLLRPSYFDVFNRSPYLIMDYCQRGSATKLIGNIKEEEAWHFLHDVASGLAYLHEQEPPIIHQDIKPNNILINSRGKYLITDFGISSKARSTLRRSVSEAKISMTAAYAPPEKFEKNLTIMASDIWSLGATLFELLEGDVPFYYFKGGEAQLSGAQIPTMKEKWSPNLKKIVTLCLQKETWNRPTAHQLVEWTDAHFKGINPFKSPSIISKTPKISITTKVSKALPYLLATASIIAISLFLIFGIPTLQNNAKKAREQKEIEQRIAQLDPILQKLVENMVDVQGGAFLMGSNDNEAYSDEKHIHQVTLDNFKIGKYEVTQAEWKAVLGYNPSYFQGDHLPVEWVSWNDIQTFIRKLNILTGKHFRLPTEAEWEYASRGGNKSQNYKYSGSHTLENVAWYKDNSEETHEVGTKSPNELGIYDMSGNVYEWCNDWYGQYSNSELTNPQGPTSGSSHLLRGGSWVHSATACRSTCRGNQKSDVRSNYFGFRLASSL